MTLVKSSAFEPAHQQLLLPWKEVVGNNLDDFLTLLYLKSNNVNVLCYAPHHCLRELRCSTNLAMLQRCPTNLAV